MSQLYMAYVMQLQVQINRLTDKPIPYRSIFMWNLTQKAMHTFIWTQNDQKYLNFDVFGDMVIFTGKNVI